MQKASRLRVGVLVVMFALLFGVWWQRQAIYDYARLYNYTAPPEVAALADRTTMNSTSRRLFYIHRPAIEDKTQFNADCTASEETIVLGCYVEGRGIYLYKVTDSRLNGVQEVTAAHEMLHAAYTRLSAPEKAKVNQMTASAYAQITDERLRKTIDAYRAKDQSVVPNELHSILGTEVRDLPSDLETYYKRYFNNRLAVVGYSEKYQQAFTDRQKQIEQYDGQLKNIKQQIDDLQSSLQIQERELRSQKVTMDTYYSERQFEAYNALVASYNTKVRTYNSLADKTQTLIDQYNNIVNNRNALAVEESQLVKAIDSRPAALQTQ